MCQLDISCNVSYESLAQLVEHLTFNQVVRGSIPRWLTIYLGFMQINPNNYYWPRGQAVKTSPFHGGDMGSIPVGVTKYATLAQLVEQLTCGIGNINYFELSCTFVRKLAKWTSLIRGRLNRNIC